ncbi:hypothetical protein VTI74DRAFT_2724 [Chaetomium olivicolor]
MLHPGSQRLPILSGQSNMSSLGGTHFPVEVLQQITSWTDPIALVALSQTSRTWRALINPLPHDFARRLLALELLPEYGGLVPRFDEVNSKVIPPFDSHEWKTARYACCGCMKLRTHMMFNNHALLRRPFRKPPPGSIESENSAVTDWEPVEPRLRPRRIYERAARVAQEGRDQIKTIVASYYEPPATSWARSWTREEDIARVADRFLAGNARHKRRCLECMYQHGHWITRRRPARGSEEVPVAVSRQLRLTDLCEMYFPGLIERLPQGQVPRFWTLKSFLATLTVVRCPSCAIWQEQGAFRQWTTPRVEFYLPFNKPMGEMICNHCYLDSHKDATQLAQELAEGLVKVLRERLESTRFRLGDGWTLIHEDFNSRNQNRSGPLSKHKAFGEELLDGLKWVDPRRRGIIIEDHDLPDLRRRVHRYRQFIYNEVDAKTREQYVQKWFQIWLEDYDLCEDQYRWLKQQIALFEKNPNLILDYVLERLPYRIEGQRAP